MWLRLSMTLTILLVTKASESGCGRGEVLVSGGCVDVESTAGGCTSPFVAVGDQCLYFVTFAEVTQQEARQMCHSLDAELVIVDTASRLNNIIYYISNNGIDAKDFWIDGGDAETEGDWRFYTGEPVPMGTPLWMGMIGEQQPDDTNGAEDCVQVDHGFLFYMNDVDCSRSESLICEQPSTDNSSSLQPVPVVECPPFFVFVGYRCLAFMTWAEQTWTEARQSCHGLGGELAAIYEIEELRAIYLYLHQEGIAGHSFWLGGSDAASEGVWIWTDGNPVDSGAPWWGYAGSSSLEPDGGSEENCLLLNAEGFHYFRDASCDLLMNPLCSL